MPPVSGAVSRNRMPVQVENIPRVSVVVPAYNCAPYVASAIASVLNQTVTDLELIVVDDGSTDGTLREIERFNDPRVIVIRHATNQGVSRATNAGLARARGRYLAALAADDLWLPAKLERQLAQLESRADLDASYTWIQHMDDAGRPLPVVERNNLGPDPVATLLTSQHIKLACTLLVRRTAIDPAALLDPRLRTNEDWEYLLRLALAGVRFGGLPEALTFVRRRPGSLSWSGMSLRDMRVALANVLRLRRAYPERISLGMVARCWLRSQGWVVGSRLRHWRRAGGRVSLPGRTAAPHSSSIGNAAPPLASTDSPGTLTAP
jgi:glycosyltransferase involved in cell wall biosynthesis